jgi:DNA-binding NtrC family response regulator
VANILVVDDDLLILDLVGKLLEQAGHKVWRMGNSRDAKALMTGPGRIDVAVIDLVLRDAPGIDLIKHVRAEYPSLPIVVISGYITQESTEIRTTLASLGVKHALAKPIDKRALLDAVAQATSR